MPNIIYQYEKSLVSRSNLRSVEVPYRHCNICHPCRYLDYQKICG